MTHEPSTQPATGRRHAQKMRIRFAHCDPAGIIYFPQYLVLFNAVVEDWFTDALGVSYAGLIDHERTGLPIVHLECDFRAITRMGEVVEFGLTVNKLGTRSLTLDMDCIGADGVLRVSARKVMVFTHLQTHASMAAPPHVREAITRWMAMSSASNQP